MVTLHCFDWNMWRFSLLGQSWQKFYLAENPSLLYHLIYLNCAILAAKKHYLPCFKHFWGLKLSLSWFSMKIWNCIYVHLSYIFDIYRWYWIHYLLLHGVLIFVNAAWECCNNSAISLLKHVYLELFWVHWC